MTLYLKYRPQKISDLDLDSVRLSISSLIGKKEIPHAFLFAGSKGAGKTSAARILAKGINCLKNNKVFGEPCGDCESCISITKGNSMDVVEMDAASHRGIDDIRALCDSANLAPSSSYKKVYILDEAHMLTLDAANAFLKTLEEPPSHVIFILATTNPEKLPATIRSRTFSVSFPKATILEVSKKLELIAKSEKINIDAMGITEISKKSGGSFRDAIKILEQVSASSQNIDKETVNNLLSGSANNNLDNLFEIIKEKNLTKIISEIENLVNLGISIRFVIDSLVETIHLSLLSKIGLDKGGDLVDLSKEDLIILSGELLNASRDKDSPIAQLPLEIAFVNWLKDSKIIQKNEVSEIKKNQAIEEKIENTKIAAGVDPDIWNKLLLKIKEKNSSVEALLRSSNFKNFDGKVVEIDVYYMFHKERMETPTYRTIFENAFEELTGSKVRAAFNLSEAQIKEKKAETSPSLTKQEDQSIISAAKDIFDI